MKLNELQPSEGSRKNRTRVGRGHGSGKGKTSGKGHKGQNARSGGGVRPGFEGGQMPLQRRVPKRGFKNKFGKEYVEVSISKLNNFDNGTVITPELLQSNGVIKKLKDGVVILGNGDLEKQLTVKASRFTKSAIQKIEAAGGKVEVI